jgi:hypothetical protein
MTKPNGSQDGPPRAARGGWAFRRLMFCGVSRWKCWCARGALGLPLALLVILAILTQTVLLKRMVLPALEAELGLEISAGWVHVGRSGALVMHDVEVRTPAVQGPAGRLLQVGMLRADVDWWSVVAGRPRLIEVRLFDPLVRLSQSVDDERLNMAGLPQPRTRASGGPPMELPRIVGRRIALELGEHRGPVYTLLKRLTLDGSLVPAVGPSGLRYDVRLAELNPRPGHPGIALSGVIERNGITAELIGLTLDQWPADVAPTPVRALFRRLDLRGDVASMGFEARDGKWAGASLKLLNVGVNLPLDREQREGAPVAERPPLRMSGVSGDIRFTPAGVRANLKGNLEDLPYTVTLNVEGLDPNGAFQMEVVSENFQIARNPDLLPYANPLIRKRFRSFSSPTGEVDTRMTVTRGPPTADGPAPVKISGLVNFSHVDAAYDKFPYRFPDLSGVVRFDDEGVDLVRIVGTAPSGAKVFATGRIAPPNSDAEVRLEIDVVDLPLDEQVERALGPDRGELMPALFSPTKYRQLLERGLVISPARAAELRAELDEAQRVGDTERTGAIEAALGTPEFAPGGVGRVHVSLHRPFGDVSDWFTTIDVHIPSAGVLVDAFPFPILAEGVSLHITDDRADLIGGTFRPLTGGEAEILMEALLHDPATGTKDFRPDVRVTARDVPVDGLFLNALPRGADGPDGRGIVQSILGGLGIGGLVDATAHVLHRPEGPLGFDVHVDMASTALDPPPSDAARPLRIANLAGAVDVSEERLDLALEGSMRLPGEGTESGGAPAGRVGVEANVVYTGEEADRRWSYEAAITGTGIDASAPVEDLVRAFSDSTADAMAERRAAWQPRGSLDALTRVAGSSESPVRAEVTISHASRASLNLFDSRASLGQAEGQAIFRLGGERGVIGDFRGVRAPFSLDGEEAGILFLQGTYDFGGGPETNLAAEISGGRFESGLTRRLVRERLGAAAGDWWDAAGPRGVYDQRLDARSGEDGEVELTGVLSPRSFAFSVPEPADAAAMFGPPLVVAFETVEGHIRFGPGGGRAEGLHARAQGWSISGDGQWTVFAPGEFSASGSASVEAARLTSDLRAILPAGLREALGTLALRIDGPLALEQGRFSLARRGSAAEAPGGALSNAPEQTADYSGRITFRDATLEAGLRITEAEGAVEFTASQPPGGGSLQYDLKIRADRLAASGVSMTDGRARVLSGEVEGHVLAPLISADCHGGRVVAQGRTWPLSASGAEGTGFEVAAQWSGLRFAPVMGDLAGAMGRDRTPVAESDMSRGVLEGEVSIAGVSGDEQSRRGRGTMRVSGGRVVQFPLVVQLIEFSNLALPVNAALDFARVSMLIDGGRIVFEDLSVFSSAVSILGYGTMSWPEMELDLRFRSRAAKPIPIIGQLIAGLRDELISTVVNGTPAKPEISLQRFTETRRLIDRAMGEPKSDQERKMDEIERRSREADPARAPGWSEPVRPSGSPSGADGQR